MKTLYAQRGQRFVFNNFKSWNLEKYIIWQLNHSISCEDRLFHLNSSGKLIICLTFEYTSHRQFADVEQRRAWVTN